jgi:predicted molibdopterin-dependent oxidoreductase YjgC
MVKLRIDKREYNAPDSQTILDVARMAGYTIPTLCHKEGLPHYSSCMVCMVKDNRTNSFLPSCSALVQDGMDIDISGEEVISLRKKAVELLLSEHRAECEAPCRVVCPAGYNIPLMNRLLTDKNYEEAYKLLISATNYSEIACVNCPGYCENACRRKKIDIPVSIRNLQLFISYRVNQDNPVHNTVDKIQNNNNLSYERPVRSGKRSEQFTSRIGKLEESELKEWLKECSGNGIRYRDITDLNSASGEAESCMHCDCRASDNCRLRDVADEFKIKDPRGKIVNSPITKKINRNTGLIFENAKCIKCGLCVRLCEDIEGEPALCFLNRGFVSIISEPITEQFDNILKTRSKQVIEVCPTGALSQFK